MFRAERRWQYSVRHFLTGIQDRNVALCRLDLYYVKLVRAILRRVPTRADLPPSSKVVSFCTLFGCGGLPAKAFLFCPMAQLSHPNNISLRIEKRQWTGLFKNVPKSPGNLADIKNFAEAVRDPSRSGLARPRNFSAAFFCREFFTQKVVVATSFVSHEEFKKRKAHYLCARSLRLTNFPFINSAQCLTTVVTMTRRRKGYPYLPFCFVNNEKCSDSACYSY